LRIVGCIEEVACANTLGDIGQGLFVRVAQEMKKFSDRTTSDGLRFRFGTYSGINS